MRAFARRGDASACNCCAEVSATGPRCDVKPGARTCKQAPDARKPAKGALLYLERPVRFGRIYAERPRCSALAVVSKTPQATIIQGILSFPKGRWRQAGAVDGPSRYSPSHGYSSTFERHDSRMARNIGPGTVTWTIRSIFFGWRLGLCGEQREPTPTAWLQIETRGVQRWSHRTHQGLLLEAAQLRLVNTRGAAYSAPYSTNERAIRLSPTTIAAAANLLKECGESVSIRAVCHVLQAATGRAARWSQVRAVILAWEKGELSIQQPWPSPATPRQHPGTPRQQIDEEPATVRQQTVPTRDISKLRLIASESNDSSAGVATQQPATKAPKQRTLPFDRPVLRLRNAILRAVWERVQPLVARSTTWTDWRKRNAVIAASFAIGGFTPEQIVYAWEVTKTRDGDPVRELFLVQRKMEHISAAKAVADEKAQARAAADAKRHYFTAPPPAPWDSPRGAKA